METTGVLLEKAARCRRLAANIMAVADPTRIALLALAEQYETRAAALPAEEDGSGHRPSMS